MAGIGRRGAGQTIEFFQADQKMRVHAPLPYDVGCGGVMGHPIDPGAQRATRIPARETAPKGEVDFLQQVAAMVGVRLVGAGEAFEGGAVCGGGFAVSVVLGSFHNQGSHVRRRFLTNYSKCSYTK